MEQFFGPWMQLFVQLIEHIGRFMDPAALMPRSGKHLFKGTPKAQGSVTDGYFRRYVYSDFNRPANPTQIGHLIRS
jgi:hypothetical protein